MAVLIAESETAGESVGIEGLGLHCLQIRRAGLRAKMAS